MSDTMTLLRNLSLLLFTCPALPGQELVRIDLPGGLPARFDVSLVRAGQPMRLLFERSTSRAREFRLRVWRADGTLTQVPAPLECTYLGTVEGEPDSLAAASLTSAGLTAWVVQGGVDNWRVTPLRRIEPGAPRSAHTLTGGWQPAGALPSCGMTAGGPTNGPVVQPPRSDITPGDAGQVRCISQADIAYDCDFEYYTNLGSSVPTVVSTVEAYTALVNTFFARDVQIRHRITEIVVRTAPFYFPTSGGHLLDLFRTEWNTNLWDVDRALAHLLTGKPGSLIEYGGLAWVGVVCNKAWAYAWSMDSPGIVGHEVGHNWGAGHCHDLSPCNNMCGACLYVGPNTKDIIEAYRDGVSCLWQSGPFEEPVPPYVYPEGTTLEKASMVGSNVAFDVLGNDEDGNCEPIALQAFDDTSVLGVPVVLSPGSGPEGRDELIYAPLAPVLGQDSFTYTAGDPSGLTSVGVVSVEVPRRPLEGCWPLTEGVGESAADTTTHGHDGVLLGAPTWSSGPNGGSLYFDGVDDAVRVPSVEVHGDQVSITAWMRRDGTQADRAGIVVTRAGNEGAGLTFGAGGELRYTWAGDPGTDGWNSGIFPPHDQWVLVALVVRSHKAVMHMHDGTNYSKATHIHEHGPQTFSGTTYIGWDPDDESRRLRGALAGVRLYGRALGQQEIDELVTLGGPAEAPLPRDGEPTASQRLSWLPSPGATAHHIYLGTDFTAVKSAGPSDPEYMGSTTDPYFDAPTFDADETYYWRVDEDVWGLLIKGETWILEVPQYHLWALDELTGTDAADSVGGKDGSYKGDPLLGEPGATSKTGTSVFLDGVDDRVRIPPLQLHDNHATIAGWVRRAGDQEDWAGIFFSRAGSTVAGLGVGLANELRFNWDNTGPVWDSGLVLPDDQWVFIVLVVEPNQATVYMGDGGPLVSSAWYPPLSPEEFDGVSLIGRDNDGGQRYFEGWVDEVRFYKGALAPDQVEALYLSQL